MRVASVVPRVRVVGVIGNHGELGGPVRREYHPESNADAMAYNIARQHLVNAAHVEWEETIATDERAWSVTDEVKGRRWFLFHGNQVKSASLGIPWYGFQKRLLGWSTSGIPFEYAVSGHWHVAVRQQVNRITHWGAGSTESGNTFAVARVGRSGAIPVAAVPGPPRHGRRAPAAAGRGGHPDPDPSGRQRVSTWRDTLDEDVIETGMDQGDRPDEPVIEPEPPEDDE